MIDLSPAAQRDLDWLKKRLGAGRVEGPWATDEVDLPDWGLEIVKSDGKRIWFYAETPDDVLRDARKEVERRTRRKS